MKTVGNLSLIFSLVVLLCHPAFGAKKDSTPPSVPTGVTARPVSCSQINLSWTASKDNNGGTGLQGYNVYRNSVKVNSKVVTTTSYSNTGLAASTGYSYQVTAVDNYNNESAKSSPAVSATTPACSMPAAATSAATSVTSSSATLNGTANPNGLATTAYFQWGTTTSYGHNTASQSIGSGTSALSVSAGITGLTASTTYHYRIVAANSAGTTYA